MHCDSRRTIDGIKRPCRYETLTHTHTHIRMPGYYVKLSSMFAFQYSLSLSLTLSLNSSGGLLHMGVVDWNCSVVVRCAAIAVPLIPQRVGGIPFGISWEARRANEISAVPCLAF